MNAKTSENNPLVPISHLKSSTFQASINLFKVSIGIGFLALPYSFNEAGYMFSSIFMILLAILTIYSTIKIIELADLKGLNDTSTFDDLFRDIVGKYPFIWFHICLFVAYIGTCICYVIFFIQFLHNVFKTDSIYFTLLYSFLSLCVIIPMSLIKKFEFFVKYSIFGNILTLIVIFFIMEYAIDDFNVDNMSNMADFSQTTVIMGVFLYSFESPGQLLAIRNSMKDKKHIKKMFILINAFVLLIYVSFSLVCCFGLNKFQITADILTGVGNINEFYLVLQGLYAVVLIISYPIQLSPVIEVLEEIPNIKIFLKNNENNWFYKNSVRILITFIIFPCGLFIKNLANFVSFLGNFSGLFIQFVIPLSAYNLFMGNKLNIFLRIFHYFIIFVSIVATLFNSYHSVLTLFQDYK